MKLTQKAQQVIEYLVLVAAVVAGVLGVSSPSGPFKGAVDRSINGAVETIHGSYSWQVGNFSACPVTCGPCTQTRVVTCVTSSGDLVADGLCSGAKPPTTNETYINCGGFVWWTSPFTPCDKVCGTGNQTRTIECRDSAGVTVASPNCTAPPPATSQACSNGPCYAWQAGTTCSGLCSVPCGAGNCPRSVTCQNTQTGEVVADANCPIALKPGPTTACNTALTCNYQWVTLNWSLCDKSCGPGKVNRVVQCRRIADGMVVGDANCIAEPKPPLQDDCYLGPCNHWGVSGTWTPCTKLCGRGNQDAIIVCLNAANAIQPDAVCLGDPESGPKPASNRECNIGACTWGNGAWGACTGGPNCGTGTYNRNVWCYRASVPNDIPPPTPAVRLPIVNCQTADAGADQNINNPPAGCDATHMCTQTRACTMKCYSWFNSSWGPCNNNCGNGTSYGNPGCQETNDGVVANNFCLTWVGNAPTYSTGCCETSGCNNNGVCDSKCGNYAESCWTHGLDECPNACNPNPISSVCIGNCGVGWRQLNYNCCAGQGYNCTADATCVPACVPNCAGKTCGPNGCSGSCGTCSPGFTCSNGNCVVAACVPNCVNKICGSDGCTGLCGFCPKLPPFLQGICIAGIACI